MLDLRLEIGNAQYLRAASCYVRMKVFVLERALALSEEFDQNDTADTVYCVLFAGSLPVATARLLTEAAGIARIGRVATIDGYRGKHLGSQVIRALENLALEKEFKQIWIHAELTAAVFYEKLGYLRDGELYEEDGVPCITLVKRI
ncbi:MULTISPECIES: GNAT family N-acetyltransferase [Enterococcus]|uniref:GNAT family N-acetyltransferase n=1 Tax=Candidatus Enterococcus murrayae TaxID=2815321 RepID=A0ABS3HMN5_9ENTE|nr:GNAT family N-acetyltransferase [Enterococcus sp. MJM16]MBO0454711.1 GNAT family N-acetyltransferase [Enterococcus sp. MJM16]